MFNRIKRKFLQKVSHKFQNELFLQYIDDTPQVLERMKARGYSPDTVIDVGAYNGGWTTVASKIFDQAKFIMLDAQKGMEKNLSLVAATNQNISYHITLLGAQPEQNKQFYVSGTGSSVLFENTDHPRSITHVDMNTLDGILSEHNISSPVLLKIDVQGYELEVLKGAANTLENVDVILLEASLLPFNEGSPLFVDIINHMEQLGFSLYELSGLKRTQKEGTLFQLDATFCRHDHFLRKIVKF